MSERILRIDHIGIAVSDLDAAIQLYRSLFGGGPDSTEEVADQKVRTAFFSAGESSVELLQPTDDDSPISKFLARRGDGIHHICLAVTDLERALDELRQRGMRLIDALPRTGAHGKRVAFVHPKSTGGVLIELSEAPRGAPCPPRRAPHDGPSTPSS
jgi:methylmalonyl-CoA/ethylmalonyl-CoA epimerase